MSNLTSITTSLASVLANHVPFISRTLRGWQCKCSCGICMIGNPTERAAELEWADHIAQAAMRGERATFTSDYVPLQRSRAGWLDA